MKEQTIASDPLPKASPPSGGRAAFSGAVPLAYRERLVPILFEEYADDIAARVGPMAGGAVLETAAGTGVVSRRLRAMLPAGTRLVVTDLSPDMLALARESVGDAPGVDFLPADATALPFADASFDAVVCQFGVMFFPDEGMGFREAARVLRPGGRFLFNVWDDLAANPIPGCVHEAIAALAPADPPRFLATPYRALDLTTMVRSLQGAGFGEIRVTVLPKLCKVESAAHAAQAFLQATPLGGQVAQRSLVDAGPAATRALASRFAAGDESAPFAAPMRAVVFEAELAD